MPEPVNYHYQDDVAVIRLDDGKANALSFAVIEALNTALDRAGQDGAKAIALIGREGKFCAGFDLSVMGQKNDDAQRLLGMGGELALRLFEMPVSVVLGVTGHALAMGALLLLSADQRIGAEGAFKIGLNETLIGMAMPGFGVHLAQERLARPYITRAVANAELFSPGEAVAAGYLDQTVAPEAVAESAIACAQQLAENLSQEALAQTKLRLRAERAAQIRRALSEIKVI